MYTATQLKEYAKRRTDLYKNPEAAVTDTVNTEITAKGGTNDDVCQFGDILHTVKQTVDPSLTPDQWITIIALIGEIVLRIIEARRPRPTP